MRVLLVPLAAALIATDVAQQHHVVGADGALGAEGPGRGRGGAKKLSDRLPPRVEAAAAGVELVGGGKKLTPPPKATEVEITWIRHALSCANVNDQYSSKKGLKTEYLHAKFNNVVHMLDPPLSDYGIHSSLKAGNDVRNATNSALHDGYFDVVASSGLLRAIETASLEFPDHRVLVLPFVSESGLGADNEISSREVQSSQLGFVHEQIRERGFPAGPEDVDHTLFEKASAKWEHHMRSMREELKEDHSWKGAFVRAQRAVGLRKGESELQKHIYQNPEKPSYEKALEFIAQNVVPHVDRLRTLKQPGGGREGAYSGPLKLAIVSHSHFLAHSLKETCARALGGRPKQRNNEAFTVKYVVVNNGYGPTLAEKFQNSCVQTAPGATDKPSSSEGLCAEEYERCVAAYDKDLMQVAPCRREREEQERLEEAERAARAAEDFDQRPDIWAEYSRISEMNH